MIRAPSPLRYWPLVVAVLGGCGSTPPGGSPSAAGASTAPAPANAPAARPTLLDEQRRLDALFRGTPVVFTMQSSGSLRVDVPLQFCFDAGQATVKPALAAVVDRLAQSQHDTATRLAVSAAADRPARPAAAASAARAPGKDGTAALANRRAAAVRDRLSSQGVGSERITLVDSDAAGVSLIVRDPALP